MQAIYHEILPPSGVEFATCLKLTPSTVAQNAPSGSQSNKRALFNIVVARSNLLRVFEVCEEPVPISTQKDDERERRASVRKGTEAVEGEVEMDASGEGFVNIGTVKVNVRLNIQSYHCHIIAFIYACNCNLFSFNCCEFCECEKTMLTPFCLTLSQLHKMGREALPPYTGYTWSENTGSMEQSPVWRAYASSTRWKMG